MTDASFQNKNNECLSVWQINSPVYSWSYLSTTYFKYSEKYYVFSQIYIS